MNSFSPLNLTVIRLSQITKFCVGIAFCLASMALMGWIFDVKVFKSLGENFVAMNPISAISFIFCSLIVAMIHKHPDKQLPRLGRFFALTVLAIATFKILSLTGIDFFIDRILFAAKISTNKMAPNTALCFFLLGLYFSTYKHNARRKYPYPETLIILLMVISMLSIAGYIYRERTFYGVSTYIPMALNTAIAFFTLALATLIDNPHQTLTKILFCPNLGGTMMRRILPAILLVPFILGWFIIKGAEHGMYAMAFSTPLLVVTSIFILVVIVWICAIKLSHIHEDLKQQKYIFESTIRSIAEAFIITDKRGSVIHSNPAARKLLDLDLHNNINPHIKMFLPDQQTPYDVFASQSQAVQGEFVDNFITCVKNSQNNEIKFIEHSARPIIDDQGKIQGVVNVFRDVTKSIARTHQLQAENNQLEERVSIHANQLRSVENQVLQLQKMDAIGRLAGGVAHDFNNILGAIYMYCDLISDENDNPSIQSSIDSLRKATEKGAALTNQLLVFSRQQILQIEPTDLKQLIPNHLKMLARLIGENIKIETLIDPSLSLIKGDHSQLEQVLMNLVINARDAMPKGGKITIKAENIYINEEFSSTHLVIQPGKYVIMSVSDTGIGMDAATKNSIFEPFFTTKPMGKGTGLGLSTVYGIVKSHNGTIWVYSEPGQGSVFNVYFPALDVSGEGNKQAGPLKAKTPLTGNETILLVEDEASLRELYASALTKQGHEVFIAGNGLEGKDLFTKYQAKIQLLIADVMMPEMGGIELVKLLTELKPELKVLFMSGFTNENIALPTHGTNLDFIQKPFSGQNLMQKIRILLDK